MVSKCVSAAIVTASITNTPGILDFLRESLRHRLLETNKGTALRDIPDRTPIQNFKQDGNHEPECSHVLLRETCYDNLTHIKCSFFLARYVDTWQQQRRRTSCT